MTSQPAEETKRVASYGRGGAGNIMPAKSEAHTTPSDLVTPTLKSDLYTTGRGGAGNMAHNDPERPEIARASQDVEAPAVHAREPEGPRHIGRGGAANVVNSVSPEPQVVDMDKRKSEDKSPVEKAKDLLKGLGGKK